MAATKKSEKKSEKVKVRSKGKRDRVECACGCGGSTYSRFCPGHDARTKGILQRAHREGVVTDEQKALIKSLGWERFMPAASNGEMKEIGLSVPQVNVLKALKSNPKGLTRAEIKSKLGRTIAMSVVLGPEQRDKVAEVEEKSGHKTLIGLRMVTLADGDGHYEITATGRKALEKIK